MLSSVSYVCLGMCAGMWVISGGIYLGVLVLSFVFNQSVEARFDSAISAIEKKKLDKAKKELEVGKKLLSKHQKLIKLADRSECGWATVSAYVTDDLADTPEDERRVSKAEKSAKKALDSKREKSPVKSGSAITNLIMILFLLFLIHASALTTLSSPLDSPFSLDKTHFCPDLSSGEEPASPVDRKDTGETTAPISFLQEDQISQPSDAFDFESLQILVFLKLAPLGNTLIFGPIPFVPPTLSWHYC